MKSASERECAVMDRSHLRCVHVAAGQPVAKVASDPKKRKPIELCEKCSKVLNPWSQSLRETRG
jgi:hypothetical protein